MYTTLTLLDLAGSIALLLWGVHMVQSGVQRAFGPHLRTLLSAALGNRAKAFGAGLGITAVLQSSTATGLMAASFASEGLVSLVPALAVMLGANVGTTLIVQVLSFDISRVAPVFILIGVMMFRRGATTRTRDLGRVAIGLGLMLMALVRLLELITPFEDVPALRTLIGLVASDPLIDVVLAAGLTWAAHSSVAVVLLIMSFVAKGVVPLNAALALVIGANLGSALNPVLEGARGADPAGRRVALGNLINRVVGCLIALPLIGYIGPSLVQLQPDLSRAVATFHTAFNVALALLFFPFLDGFARLLRYLIPARIDAEDPSRPIYLDENAFETPSIAIGYAAREALRMADMLEAMLRKAGEALEGNDRQRVAETRRMDDALDGLNAAIKSYLAALDPEDMLEPDHRRMRAILDFTTNLEHAGDVIDKNVMGIASKRLKRGLPMPEDRNAPVQQMLDRLEANLRSAASVFMTEDPRAARHLADEKAVFRDLEAKATTAHFESLRLARGQASEVATLNLDLVRDLKTVNAHLVAAAAYPVLQAGGELMETRHRSPNASRDDDAPREPETPGG